MITAKLTIAQPIRVNASGISTRGARGKSTYELYLETTTDNPPMTEEEFVNSKAVLEQTTGQSTTHGMSQKAVTDELALKADSIDLIEAKQSISTLESVLSDVNINQEAQVTASGVDTVLLQKTAANTGMQVQLFGQSAQNLVVNGDFRNGATGWIGISGSLSVVNGELHNNGTNEATAQIYQNILLPSQKYYFRYYYRIVSGTIGVSAGGMSVILNDVSSGTGYFGKIHQTSSTNGNLVINFPAGTDAYVDNIMAINLTATFGAGNEPTKEQCDILFANYFEGSDNVLGTGRVRSVGKNLVDKSILKTGYHIDTSGNFSVDPSRLFLVTTQKIKIAPGKVYSLSGLNVFGQLYLWIYDRYDNPILLVTVPSSNTTSFTSPNNASYIRFRSYNVPLSITDALDSIQMELGSTTTYKPYKESSLYLTTPELRSNGLIKDEIRKGTNGYELVKRVGVGTLGSELITNAADREFSSDTGFWTKAANVLIDDGALKFNSVAAAAGISRANLLVVGQVYRVELTVVSLTAGYLLFSGNTTPITTTGLKIFYVTAPSTAFNLVGYSSATAVIDNISIKQVTLLNGSISGNTATELGSNIHYTLATPTITPIAHAGLLNSNSNGTAYFEPIIADAGVYSSNLAIQLTDYPIASFESIRKYANGTYTELNTATAVIASGGLSFTHPDLASGDLVMFTYAYNKESVGRSMTLTHYDNRYVKVDTANGKTYRIDFVVTNGVVVPTATEV